MNLDKIRKLNAAEDYPGEALLWYINTIDSLVEEVVNLRKHLTDSHACFDPIVNDAEEEKDPTYGDNPGWGI